MNESSFRRKPKVWETFVGVNREAGGLTSPTIIGTEEKSAEAIVAEPNQFATINHVVDSSN